MNQPESQSDVEAYIRRFCAPDSADVARLLARVSGGPAPRRRRHGRLIWQAAMVGMLAVGVVWRSWLPRSPRVEDSPFTITGDRELVMVERAVDGRRWVVVPAQASAQHQTGAPVSNPREVRVTMDYRNRPAPEVLQTLARAAGLTVSIATGPLLPVTTAVTNVRLETALNAVCENASCRWTLHDRAVIVTPVPIDTAALLPRTCRSRCRMHRCSRSFAPSRSPSTCNSHPKAHSRTPHR